MAAYSSSQTDLFDAPAAGLPEGVRYVPEALTPTDEAGVVAAIAVLDLQPFAFHGFTGNRRVAWFGWRYDYGGGGFQRGAPMPDFLLPLRAAAATVAGIDAASLEQALVTEYSPGAGIGWHRDRPEFGTVAAVSLSAPCRLRFRRRVGEAWERRAQIVAPRSIYVLDGPGRHHWQHSIPPVDQLRYSITFRTLASV